jgi:hypothetical protein
MGMESTLLMSSAVVEATAATAAEGATTGALARLFLGTVAAL